MSSLISKCIFKYTSINREVRFLSLFFLWPFAIFSMRVFLKKIEELHNPIVLIFLIIPELLLCVIWASIGILFLIEWHTQVTTRVKNVILSNILILMSIAWLWFSITYVSEYFFNLILEG